VSRHQSGSQSERCCSTLGRIPLAKSSGDVSDPCDLGGSKKVARPRATQIMWIRVTKFDKYAVKLADQHYSRRKPGSSQFMPPGQTIVLLSENRDAVWGWWRPHPSSGIKQMNGLDGWTCTIFRNTGRILSSKLILAAEKILKDSGETCGPNGMLTYVWGARIRSTNPGYCFKRAGWVKSGMSADGKKTLLSKPFCNAGI
jgi:hypothetical protein